MLRSWLDAAARAANDVVRFSVIDVSEIATLTPEIERWVAERLRLERFHPRLVEDMLAALGWDDAVNQMKAGMPSVATVRKGVLGEVLAAECICEFGGYVIPVRKLRSMLASGQSLPGTDILAFQCDQQGRIVRACYIEAKLRTFRDLPAGVVAEEQLAKDMNSRVPQILLFVANALYEASDPLADGLRNYMYARETGHDIDEFRIHLTWEKSEWSEDVLTNLAAADERLSPLNVCVLLIANLDPFIERVYSAIGIGADPNDD